MKAFPVVALSRVAAQPHSEAGQSSPNNVRGQEMARLGLGLTFLTGITIYASLNSHLGTNTAGGMILTLAAMAAGGYLAWKGAWSRAPKPAAYSPNRIGNYSAGPIAFLLRRFGRSHRSDHRLTIKTFRLLDPCRVGGVFGGGYLDTTVKRMIAEDNGRFAAKKPRDARFFLALIGAASTVGKSTAEF